MVIYFDDILVFSQIEEEHYEHLGQVMMILEQEKLHGFLKKCFFFTLKVVFLVFRMKVSKWSNVASSLDLSLIYA